MRRPAGRKVPSLNSCCVLNVEELAHSVAQIAISQIESAPTSAAIRRESLIRGLAARALHPASKQAYSYLAGLLRSRELVTVHDPPAVKDHYTLSARDLITASITIEDYCRRVMLRQVQVYLPRILEEYPPALPLPPEGVFRAMAFLELLFLELGSYYGDTSNLLIPEAYAGY